MDWLDESFPCSDKPKGYMSGFNYFALEVREENKECFKVILCYAMLCYFMELIFIRRLLKITKSISSLVKCGKSFH